VLYSQDYSYRTLTEEEALIKIVNADLGKLSNNNNDFIALSGLINKNIKKGINKLLSILN
jgi:hypothetical protein